jgi:hypothetical protein
MAKKLLSPSNNGETSEFNVSLELQALRDEVSNNTVGNFRRELENIKSQSKLFLFDANKMGEPGSSVHNNVVFGDNNLSERIIKIERDFFVEVNKLNTRIDNLLEYI